MEQAESKPVVAEKHDVDYADPEEETKAEQVRAFQQ